MQLTGHSARRCIASTPTSAIRGALVLLPLLAACQAQSARGPAPGSRAGGEARIATVNGVRLQYLDWGGTGPGLIFLPGLGDSPHAYDEIAPAFTDHFRVIACARRAHGGSEARPPYDVPTLAEDLRQLLVHLKIGPAVLVGWSMGGLEISELAARDPGLVAGVVFLDSYDLSDPAITTVLRDNPLRYDPVASDLVSIAAFRRWWKRANAPNVPWSAAMRGEVDDLVEIRPDGSVRLRVSDSLQGEIFDRLRAYHPRYDAIRAPMLVFWARPYVGAFLDSAAPDTLREKVQRWIDADLRPWRDSAMTRLRRLAPAARVVVLDSTGHSALPFQRGDTIRVELRRFLERLGPGDRVSLSRFRVPQRATAVGRERLRRLARE